MLNISQPSTSELFSTAFGHHLAGEIAQAEALYRRILAQDPQHADALHLLGVIACGFNHYDAAIELMQRAIVLHPRHPAYHSNLGEACRKAGRFELAAAEFQTALAIDPCFGDAYTNFAVMLLQQDRGPEALELLRRAVLQVPRNATAWRLLGDAHWKIGEPREALDAYQQALALNPGLVEARFNLANVLNAQSRPQEAVEQLHAVLAQTPGDVQARLMMAEALSHCGSLPESLAEYERTLQHDLAPAISAQAHAGLANVLRAGGRIDEAISAYRKSLELRPDHAVTRANLAFALRDQARLGECEALLREALEREPGASAIRSGLIFTMHLNPRISRRQIEEEQARWNQLHVESVREKRLPHANARDRGHQLRVGYVSADFRQHPVGRFMLPLLQNHDRTQAEIFCYSSTLMVDAFSAQLQAAADHWRPIASLDDERAAALIRQDGIDILIDLSNHTIGNRLTLFAFKPAPVQISYLAYNAGTGMRTMDWRLTDPYIDPPGAGEETEFEKPLRLAQTYWCYSAHADACGVSPLPADSAPRHGVTFGSLNYFSKANDDVLALWARLLGQIPHSRLVIHVPAGSRQTHVREFFGSTGLDATRLEFAPRTGERAYFERYHGIDIALDPFPWSGGTTTCDALYMGVPVLTLAGAAPHETLSRGSASLLSNLGLTDWIARTPEEYVNKARAFAADLSILRGLRAELRERMQSSCLMNAAHFARDVEAAYRKAWFHYCSDQQP